MPDIEPEPADATRVAPQDWAPDEGEVARVDAATAQWSQGDVASPGISLWLSRRDRPLTPETAELAALGHESVGTTRARFDGVVIVTQTCDIQRSSSRRPFVQACPLVELTGGELANARSGRIARYAPVPGAGPTAFADLDRCTTIEKTVLVELERTAGCPDDASKLAFSAAVARQRGRFAFPDGLDEALQELRRHFTKRAGKRTPEGVAVDSVLEIRARARSDGWSASPVALSLVFIIDQGSLPPADEWDQAAPELVAWLVHGPRSPEQLARRLAGLGEPADRELVWQRLVTAWARLCSGPAVRDLEAEAISAGEYPHVRGVSRSLISTI